MCGLAVFFGPQENKAKEAGLHGFQARAPDIGGIAGLDDQKPVDRNRTLLLQALGIEDAAFRNPYKISVLCTSSA